jgi:hypothetical protein
MYSDKVIDHFNSPRNVGSLDKNSPDVGTGLVGAPECGDVMKLQIKVENGIITDAKFKTFGCVVSRTKLNAKGKSTPVSSLVVGQEVVAWNGTRMIINRIAEITKHVVPISDLWVTIFARESSRKGVRPLPLKLVTTLDHVFWTTQQAPIEAGGLKTGDKLFEITEFELRQLNDPSKTGVVKETLADHMRWLTFGKSYQITGSRVAWAERGVTTAPATSKLPIPLVTWRKAQSVRKYGKLDANQVAIIRDLRKMGLSVLSLADHGEGCPDILVGSAGENFLFEIKNPCLPPSKRRLTEQEQVFHDLWRGQVRIVETLEDVMYELAVQL